jgi:hypothetical protein
VKIKRIAVVAAGSLNLANLQKSPSQLFEDAGLPRSGCERRNRAATKAATSSVSPDTPS